MKPEPFTKTVYDLSGYDNDWVLKQPIAPVFTSDYIRMVQSFISVQLEMDGNAFAINDYEDCLTVRFDVAQGVPNVKACENIIGYAEKNPGGFMCPWRPGKAVRSSALQKNLCRPWHQKMPHPMWQPPAGGSETWRAAHRP